MSIDIGAVTGAGAAAGGLVAGRVRLRTNANGVMGVGVAMGVSGKGKRRVHDDGLAMDGVDPDPGSDPEERGLGV